MNCSNQNKFDYKHIQRVGIVVVFVSDGCQHPDAKQGVIVRQKCKDCKNYNRR